jgi:hypothetical protein
MDRRRTPWQVAPSNATDLTVTKPPGKRMHPVAQGSQETAHLRS